MRIKALIISLAVLTCVGCSNSVTKGNNNNHYLTKETFSSLTVGTDYRKVDQVLGTKAKTITKNVEAWNNIFLQTETRLPPSGYAWLFTRHDLFKPRWYAGFMFDSNGKVIQKQSRYIR